MTKGIKNSFMTKTQFPKFISDNNNSISKYILITSRKEGDCGFMQIFSVGTLFTSTSGTSVHPYRQIQYGR